MKTTLKLHTTRFLALLFFLFPAIIASAADFEPPIVLESPNAESGGSFGSLDVSAVPDVNGDGKADILVSAWLEDPGSSPSDAGRVYLFDGATRELLRELKAPVESQTGRFGYGSTGIADLNGDGRGEVIVASASTVYVLDGATGEQIQMGAMSGRRVSSVPDVNGDGIPEIVAGDFSNGVVRIYDGANGQRLKAISGGRLFGWSVSGIPDVNGDGAGDVIIGEWMANRAYIHDGATGARLHTLTGSGEYGRSVVGLGDVNGDGRGDVAVGAWSGGGAFVYDGATGGLLHTLVAPDNAPVFGWVLNRLPDVDGDGRDDVIVAGFPNASQRPANAYIFSGATGKLVATLPGHSDDGGGRTVAGLPDVNGDGLAEVLVANSYGASSSGFSGAGQVYLHLSKAAPKPPALAAIGRTAEGFKLRLTGSVGATFELQGSEDLLTWSTVAKQTQTEPVEEFLDAEAKDKSRRFYRIRSDQ